MNEIMGKMKPHDENFEDQARRNFEGATRELARAIYSVLP